ncbi:hypothetical protein Tco_0709036 [Tanacetum coccineum]
MEHQLKAYPLAEPVIHKKQPFNPDQRRVLKEKVYEWLKGGIIRKVQYPGWVTNAIPVKQRDDAWQVHMDYSSLNKVCAKDMYPFPEVEEELESLMGYQYKCFLRLPKECSQVRIYPPKDDGQGVRGIKGAKCGGIPRRSGREKQDRA